MGEHKVSKGETLSGIAKQYGMNFGELLKLNGIDPSKANHIQIGQVIKTKQKPEQTSNNQSLPIQSFSSPLTTGVAEWAAQKDEEMARLTRGAEQAAQARRNAYQKANANVQVPMRPKLVSKEVTQAINLQEQLYALGYDLGSAGIDGNFGAKSKAALAQAQKDGYILQDGKLVKPTYTVAQPAKNGVWNSVKNMVSNPIYDNMYPYNYGDVQTPNGYRQVSGSDPLLVQAQAGTQKVISGFKEMDPRRDLMNRMVEVDLNTEEGLSQWRDLVNEANNLDMKMVRYKGSTLDQIKNQQWEMRARLDAMNLYQGRPQQWDTYVEQNDESKRSGRATQAGKPTLIIRDQNQRNRINGELLNYWNAHPEQRIKGDNGLYRMPVMSYLGNASIVQQSDGSLRYADDWDYTWTSDNDPNRPYFGEVLSDFSGKGYGTGVNSKSFDEGLHMSDLYQEGKKYVQNMFTNS